MSTKTPENLPEVASHALFGVWHPITTAPKDGTVIDLWCGLDRFADCWWHIFENGNGYWAVEIKPNGDIMCLNDPTHWMPLPIPPNAKSAATGSERNAHE